MKGLFSIYDCLAEGIDSDLRVSGTLRGQCWTAVRSGDRFGMAMTTPVDTLPRMEAELYPGMCLKDLAATAKSWNLTEAGYGMAAVNAFYNTPQRLEELGAYEPFENYCTHGLDLYGKRIGIVGHLNMPDSVKEAAEKIWILERNPRPGDYPDSACEWILPRCDVVIITASTFVNKTLPRLLELSRDAYTIVAGPSCPMCPGLLEMGIDRLAGLVITDAAGMEEKIRQEIPGPPYGHGSPFLLTKER